MKRLRVLSAVMRLEFAEIQRSRWVMTATGLFALLMTAFVFFGLRESAVLGFTGIGRSMLAFSHALVYLLPLVALAISGQAVIGERDSGMLELLLSNPVPRGVYYAAATLTRLLTLLVPLVAVMLVSAFGARLLLGDTIPWGILWRATLLCGALICCFVGIGMTISTATRKAARSVIYVMLTWLLAVGLLDVALIGLMLRWRLEPYVVFACALVNPVEAARIGLLATVEPELSILGPVGFFVANRIGATPSLLFGILWPLLLGAIIWLAGYQTFRGRDLF